MNNKKPYEAEVVGVDVGNSTTIGVRTGYPVVLIPSIIGTLAGEYDGPSKQRTDTHHITFEKQAVTVGTAAFYAGGWLPLMRRAGIEAERYVSRHSLYCFLAAVSALYPEADLTHIVLATGLPPRLYKAHAEAVKAFYTKAFKYSYNGHERKVVVEATKVFAEGTQTWRLAEYEQETGPVAYHDIGGKTWNVSVRQSGSAVYTRTFEYGLERLLDQTVATANEEERWNTLRQLRTNATAHSSLRQAVTEKYQRVLAELETQFPLLSVNRHVLCGGGALLAKAAFDSYTDKPTTVIDEGHPEHANARAYAMAARVP